jgi:alcohol dehydrogenase (cytochrome c)
LLARRLRPAGLLAAVLAVLAAAGCGSGDERAAPAADVTWPAFGGTPTQTRSSPLADVTPDNVGDLGVAWSLTVQRDAPWWETYPVVVGRTMYLTTNEGQVLALDATTGARQWTFTPDAHLLAGGALEGPPVHRGVTVVGDRVFLATHDAQLIALDADTGRQEWTTRVADPRTGAVQNSPPAYLDGLVVVGSAGKDVGVRGFVAAYDARTGKQRWRFWTVPKPGDGWMPAGSDGGGGHVWMPPTADPATHTVYAGTGNRSPALGAAPEGCAEWTDATIALDARTGRLKWGHSEQCGDSHDMDSGQPPAVFRAPGADADTVGHANKDGTYWLLGAADGSVLARSAPLVPQDDPRPRATAQGTKVCPGALGGVAYSPAAVRGDTVFQAAVVQCMRYLTTAGAKNRDVQAGAIELGGGLAQAIPGQPATGVMVALDARTAEVRWRRPMPAPLVGGTLATASGLVFSGSDDGYLYAFGAGDGKVLWRGRVGLPFGSAPLTYRIDGVQYVAAAAGGSSLSSLNGLRGGARLVVLKVGGKRLPAAATPR